MSMCQPKPVVSSQSSNSKTLGIRIGIQALKEGKCESLNGLGTPKR